MLIGFHLMFDIGDFSDAARMTPPFKICLQPDFNHPRRQSLAQQIRRKTQDIRIVMPTAHLGRQFIMAKRGADTGKFVGDDAHTDSAATNQNRAISLSFGHCARSLRPEVGIIDAFGGERPQIDALMSQFSDLGENSTLDLKAAMITGNDNFHKSRLNLLNGRRDEMRTTVRKCGWISPWFLLKCGRLLSNSPTDQPADFDRSWKGYCSKKFIQKRAYDFEGTRWAIIDLRWCSILSLHAAYSRGPPP